MKIKDLSLDQVVKICFKHVGCNNCPLARGKNKPCIVGHVVDLWYEDKDYLDKEIEENED